MYAYDSFDQELVDQRVDQFRGQVDRRLSGDLSEDEFRPLRLLNRWGGWLPLPASQCAKVWLLSTTSKRSHPP
jgi:hypothetical protein